MGGDRLSSLGDGALGRVLSLLPSSKEAARAAALSSRFRDAFAFADAVSMEEPELPLLPSDYEEHGCGCMGCSFGKPVDPNPPPPFATAVTAALLARHRLDAPAAPPPLRALRVALNYYRREDKSQVDHWLSYALKHAAAVDGLEICLRLRRGPLCGRKYSLVARRKAASFKEKDEGSDAAPRGRTRSRSESLAGEEEDAGRRATRRRRRSGSGDETDGDDAAAAAASDYDNHFADYPPPRQPSAPRGSPGSHDPGADPDALSPSASPPPGDEDDVVSDAEDPRARPDWPLPSFEQPPSPEYAAPRSLFSFAKLRALAIGPCRLSPPPAISLPCLETLLLTDVSDTQQEVHRLISACPRLADLTLEACETVAALSLLQNTRLRRLALRCCHSLATVAIDGTLLRSFEYRGAVPDSSFLTFHGGAPSFASCKVDICGKEVSSPEELGKLGEFLKLLASTRHLHLQSARLGSGAGHAALPLPAFTNLRRLELTGRLPHDDDAMAAVADVSRILRRAPSLEALSLFFGTGPSELHARQSWQDYNEGELLDSHHLRYNEHEVLDVAPAAAMAVPPCLRHRVREINLVHYHGGRAQRTLAKFLLCNAPVLRKLYCGFARGPLWIQTKLRDEIRGWAMNKAENIIFS